MANTSYTVQVPDDGVHTIRADKRVVLSSDIAVEFNHGGDVYLPLAASTNYGFDGKSEVRIHAPSGGGAATLTVVEGETTR